MPPWLVLLLLLSLALALVYQLITRRYGWRAIAYWVVLFAALAGFEAMAETAGFNAIRVGDLRLLPVLVGGAAVLTAFWFLGI